MNLRKFREQAKNDNTKPGILAKLSKNKDKLIRKYVASNPNTPVEILEILGAEFPERVIKNPIFNLLLLENSSSYFIKLSLARSSKTKPETLNRLANLDLITVKEIEIIYAISRHKNIPVIVLEKLLTWHPDYNFLDGSNIHYFEIMNKIEYLVANNPDTSPYLLNQIAFNRSKNIDNSIPINRISSQTKERLKSSINFKILRAIANNKNTSSQTIEYLAGEFDSLVHQIILKHPHISQKARDVIKFRQGRLKKTPYFLTELASDTRKEVRALVASHYDTPISIIKLLAKDREILVLFAIAQRFNLPTIILEELAKNSSKQIHKAVLKHPNVSDKAKDIIQLMRSRVPLKIKDSILEELAHDERVKVRKKVVQNEFTPSYILKKLTRDSEKYIRDKAIKNLTLRNLLITENKSPQGCLCCCQR